MLETVISVENLGKRYTLNHMGNGDGYATLRDVIARKAVAPLRGLGKVLGHRNGKTDSHSQASGRSSFQNSVENFWALRNVSFQVKEGEVFGIIGRNGAGKSTLLKILSRITEPTEGRVRIKGRVASLLEVGTGFHPELTGRENIYLNGSILGMKRAEIKVKFDEIVAFAEVERFLDTPVKRYSSGMYVRLAFAVAAHLEPEILIVDEVLAVGDVEFQKKCLGKMQDVSTKQGRTVLFVSHNMSAVQQLTTTGLVFANGQLFYQGPSHKAIEMYSGSISDDNTTVFEVEHARRKYVGTMAAKFISLRFDRPVPLFQFGDDFEFYAKIRARDDISKLRFSITVFTADAIPVGSCFSVERPGPKRGEEVEYKLVLPSPRLAPGHYFCGVALGKGDNRTGHLDFDVVMETLMFEVAPEQGAGATLAAWTRGWGTIVFRELIMA
ncbi:MAG: ABC transporter ATP-binding protein [Verrucomicrobia bacterium]|nr:ABC transporter ATP-binding protein [Verrucomicrobiota bacterium]